MPIIYYIKICPGKRGHMITLGRDLVAYLYSLREFMAEVRFSAYATPCSATAPQNHQKAFPPTYRGDMPQDCPCVVGPPCGTPCHGMAVPILQRHKQKVPSLGSMGQGRSLVQACQVMSGQGQGPVAVLFLLSAPQGKEAAGTNWANFFPGFPRQFSSFPLQGLLLTSGWGE